MREEPIENNRSTFAEKVISFYRILDYQGKIPEGITVMNPFINNPEILTVASLFYRKFYSDMEKRHLILGINPGRFGAGVTGIPFTDTHQLFEKCGIQIDGINTREMSSVFIYDMIEKYGTVTEFYSSFFISAVCPLGFTSTGKKGNEINYNYYDNKELTAAVYDFIVQNLTVQISFGINTDICFCLGTGKNFKFLSDLNSRFGFFGEIVPLEHPRFIMQYRLKQKKHFIDHYLEAFRRIR